MVIIVVSLSYNILAPTVPTSLRLTGFVKYRVTFAKCCSEAYFHFSKASMWFSLMQCAQCVQYI